MEAIWNIVVFIGSMFLIGVVFGIGAALLRYLLGRLNLVFSASTKTITKGGSFTENINEIEQSNEPLKMRMREAPLSEKEDSLMVLAIEVIGVLPNANKKRLGFYTSVLDVDGEQRSPVVSAIETFQEEKSRAYQSFVNLGEVSGNQRFVRWIRAGVVITDILQPPYGGSRTLSVILRLVDLDNPPVISKGFHNSEEGILWIEGIKITRSFEEKGYREEVEHTEESQAIVIHLAVAVAFVDGSLQDSEGMKIKEWISELISSARPEDQERLRSHYNQAMRDAYHSVTLGNMNLSTITARLNETGNKRIKYEAIDLCLEVMSADGQWQREELELIKRIAESLALDFSEIEKMKDQKIITMNFVSAETSNEQLLGISEEWSLERKRQHLRVEFQKWNNRISALPEGEERENAQKMLDLIAEARKKCA
jgi:uncharacterized tellurite resistance protein B-like protein